MERTLTNFIHALRSSDVRVSTAETLDAFNAVELVGYEDRGALKRSLALVLPKTADEKETFDLCFDQFFKFTDIRGDRDGTVKAYRLEVLGDVGAYANMGAFLPFFTHAMSSGVYTIPKIETGARSIVTNTSPTMAYRGAGRPEATAAVERAIDLFAAERWIFYNC